jgi:hypothetical protein
MIINYSLTGLILMLITSATLAQKNAGDSLATAPDTRSSWSFAADAYYYMLPAEKNTTVFIGPADYRSLHLEGRYNYEDRRTASLFVGYNLEAGHKLTLAATPMIGFAVGNTNGIVPGLEMTLTWLILDFYSESEYVFDLEGKENDYFYTWTQLAITPFPEFQNRNCR